MNSQRKRRDRLKFCRLRAAAENLTGEDAVIGSLSATCRGGGARSDPSPEQISTWGKSIHSAIETFFDRMEVFFGSGLNRMLRISRGRFHYIEGGLASAANPGSEALGSRINDNNFFYRRTV